MHLWWISGKLKVKGKGFWFTPAGKGSFGFLCHLKNEEGLPVYPDTQVKGNLRTAIKRILYQEGKSHEDAEKFLDIFMQKVYISDLVPVDPANWTNERFTVKPRISINMDTRTVQTHMLTFEELAYVDGLELQAHLYMGYLLEEEKKIYKELVEKAVPLIYGFGKSRSKGFGEGEFTIEWQEEKEFKPLEETDIHNGLYILGLENLTHFKGKPIELRSYQYLLSERFIHSDQLKGWLVKIYSDLYKTFPKPEEISLLNFSFLYPSLKKDNNIIPFIPLPQLDFSRDEDTGQSVVHKKKKIFKGKEFMSLVKIDDKILYHSIACYERIRNRLDDSFKTEEDSLFVQEFIPEGNVFAGFLHIVEPKNQEEEVFLKRVLWILKNFYPVIRGVPFKTFLKPFSEDNIPTLPECYVLTKPVPFNQAFFGKNNRLRITTLKTYNTVLGRPRRPLICFQAGSIFKNRPDTGDPATFFPLDDRGELVQEEPILKKAKSVVKRTLAENPLIGFVKEAENFSRSKLGFFRKFTNNLSSERVSLWKDILIDRINKFEKKGQGDHPEYQLLKEMLKLLEEDPSGKKLADCLNSLLREVLYNKWQKET